MKFTLALPGQNLYPGHDMHWFSKITGKEILSIAKIADDLGFDYLRVGEHVAMDREWAKIMGPRWLDCLTTLSFVAGVTNRIKIATSVLVLPYHQPIRLAKEISTLDYLSHGRLHITLGVGYMEWEYKMLKVPFVERGRIMDEYIDAMIELWTQDNPTFHGNYVSFDNIVFEPKPLQKPYPTLWFGGYSKYAFNRVARLGNGCQPWGISRSEIPKMIGYIKNQEGFKANPRELDFFSNLFEGQIDPHSHKVIEAPQVFLDKDYVLTQVQQLANVGVTVTDVDSLLNWGEFGNAGAELLPPINCLEEYIERLHWIGENILPQGHRIT